MTDSRRGVPEGAGRAWILLLCGYSLARAVLAWPLLTHYSINPAAFLVLDVGTAYPLGLAQIRIVDGFGCRDFAAVQRWSAIAGVAFVTPYAYLLAAGRQELPTYVEMGVVAVVMLIATATVLRIREACLGNSSVDGLADPVPATLADDVV